VKGSPVVDSLLQPLFATISTSTPTGPDPLRDVGLIPVLVNVELVDPMPFLPPTVRKAVREAVRGVDETAEVAGVVMVAVRPCPARSDRDSQQRKGDRDGVKGFADYSPPPRGVILTPRIPAVERLSRRGGWNGKCCGPSFQPGFAPDE